MAEGVEDADRGHRAADNSQDLPDQLVHRGLVLLIDDVDGLDLSHEHGLLRGLKIEGGARPD